MRKIISLCVSLAILIAVAAIIAPGGSGGITYGKGKERNASITNDEELVDLMDSAVYLFENISGKSSKSLENWSDDTTEYQNLSFTNLSAGANGKCTYDSMTMEQEFSMYTGMKYTVNGTAQSVKVSMSGSSTYYITEDAVLIMLDAFIETSYETTAFIHMAADYYIDRDDVLLRIRRLDSSDGTGDVEDDILNKWINVNVSDYSLDYLAELLQQLTLDAIPATLECTRDYFRDNKDTAFDKRGNVYDIKDDHFKEFYDVLSQAGASAYEGMGVSTVDTFNKLSGNYSFDLSNKQAPVFYQEVAGEYSYSGYECDVRSTTNLRFENINNTVLEAPTEIWELDDIIGGNF